MYQIRLGDEDLGTFEYEEDAYRELSSIIIDNPDLRGKVQVVEL